MCVLSEKFYEIPFTVRKVPYYIAILLNIVLTSIIIILSSGRIEDFKTHNESSQ